MVPRGRKSLRPRRGTAFTNAPGAPRAGAAFTLIELLVVIAIISILAAILFPVFAQAREKARSISCISNLKQIGTAFMMYIQDYDGGFPSGARPQDYGNIGYNCNPAYNAFKFNGGWVVPVHPYIKNAGIYSCPSANRPFWLGGKPEGFGSCTANEFTQQLKVIAPNGVTYLYKGLMAAGSWYPSDGAVVNDAEFDLPAQNALIFEYASWHKDRNTVMLVAKPRTQDPRNMALNAVFADGHAKYTIHTQWRHLHPDFSKNNAAVASYWGDPPQSMDLDWFLSPDWVQVPRPTSGAHDIK